MNEYNNNLLFRERCRTMVAIAFLPAHMIVDEFIKMEDEFEDNEKPIFRYFDENYVRGKVKRW